MFHTHESIRRVFLLRIFLFYTYYYHFFVVYVSALDILMYVQRVVVDWSCFVLMIVLPRGLIFDNGY